MTLFSCGLLFASCSSLCFPEEGCSIVFSILQVCNNFEQHGTPSPHSSTLHTFFCIWCPHKLNALCTRELYSLCASHSSSNSKIYLRGKFSRFHIPSGKEAKMRWVVGIGTQDGKRKYSEDSSVEIEPGEDGIESRIELG